LAKENEVLLNEDIRASEVRCVGDDGTAYGVIPRVEALKIAEKMGLDLVKFYPVPHYGEEPFVQSAAEILKAYGGKLNLAPINNAEAIAVHGDKFEILGR